MLFMMKEATFIAQTSNGNVDEWLQLKLALCYVGIEVITLSLSYCNAQVSS